MTDKERLWDQRLQIRTGGRDDKKADQYYHPYEPTPYNVLERLADSGFFGEGSEVLDYGCGKGRVGFFLSRQTGAKVTGIEYDERIYHQALENQRSALSGMHTAFVHMRAEEYPVPAQISRCYFFNPFSVEILHKVMARLRESYYLHPREILLFFYYPSDEFVVSLMLVEELEFYDEIFCGDLFGGKDPRERILIFQFPHYETGEEF